MSVILLLANLQKGTIKKLVLGVFYTIVYQPKKEQIMACLFC